MAEVPLDRFPIDVSPEDAVAAAYAEDVRAIVEKLRHGVSVLVECDKQLATHLLANVQTALRQHEVRVLMVEARAQRPGGGGGRRRTLPGQQPPPEDEEPTMGPPPSAKLAIMAEELARIVPQAGPDDVVAIRHLDLLASTHRAGLDVSIRNVVATLYDNPEARFLAFKDPELDLPEVVKRLFGWERTILGIRREVLPQIVARREARKFGGPAAVEVNLLYKYLSGVNAWKIRQILPQFADRSDWDPRNEEARATILREIRETTCGSDMEVPRVRWDDIGGYQGTKKKIEDGIMSLIAMRDRAQDAARTRDLERIIPRGILFEGPPGTGKTFFAKAIATAIDAAVIVVSGPELKSTFVGESERNLRNVFIRARKAAPAIIIFDEIDSFATSRGKAAPGDPGVQQGMVNTLLTEMDGFKNNPAELVLVVGTTNFAKSLDPALLRPGRFEFVLRVPAPNDRDRHAILDIYRRKYGLMMDDALLEHAVRRTAGFADPANRRRFSGDDLHAVAKELARVMVLRDQKEPFTTEQVDQAVRGLTRGGKLASAGKLDMDRDIAGYDDVKRRLKEDVLDMLKAGRWDMVPDAILLEGPPGTGKTLFARAIADSVDAAIIMVSGPELKSKWIGESEQNVREVFEEARNSAPAIVVFDEMDSFAGKRVGSGGSEGSKAHDSMVNQLLTEMQGFSAQAPVLVVGTTNFAEALDPAVLRRFAYVVTVPAPSEKERRLILEMWARKLSLEIPDDVLSSMVERMAGWADPNSRRKFSGDDIENVCQDLARMQVRKGPHPVTMEEAEQAIGRRIVGGPQHGPRKLTAAEKAEEDKATAYHECGHALVAIVLREASWPFKVSIEAPEDGGYLGITMKEVKEGAASRAALLSEVCSALGGRAAEILVLGDHSTGASNDLAKATDVVRAMVEDLGMSEDIGPVVYAQRDPWSGQARRREISPRLAERIDAEVERILKEQADRARALLEKHRDALEDMTQALLQERKLDDVWLARFAGRHGFADRVPERLKGLVGGAPRPAPTPPPAPDSPPKGRRRKANDPEDDDRS